MGYKMKNRKNDVFWGVVFILLAVLVIISEMDLIHGIGFWTIVFTVIWGATLISGIFKRDIPRILFSIAFLCIVWDEILGIENLTPWPVLLAATLGSIGFSKIFGKKDGLYEKRYFESMHSNSGKKSTIEMESGDDIDCSVSFGSMVKYANSENLRSVYVSASFGAASIYLDKAQVPDGEVAVKIVSSFSAVQLYVPKDWKVVDTMRNAFSGIKEEGLRTGEDNVKLVLEGKADFSGVTITYI